MKYYCIASPHKNELWYDYRLYVNLKQELAKLGFQYRAGAHNRIYFLGAPQRHFYKEVGKFDSSANNIALVYCHPEKLESINQFSNVFVCSNGFRQYLSLKKWKSLELFKNNKPFTPKKPISVIPPFSSLQPATKTMPRYKCDVSFMGVPRVRPAIDALLPLVPEMDIKLHLFGPGWHNYPGNVDPEPYWIAKQIPYEHIPMLARGSKICLIDHHDSMNQIGSVSHKYIDFVMSGGFVVSDYNKDAIKYYDGVCFSQERPLKDILLEYLNDEEKRRAHVLKQQKIIVKQTTMAAAIELASCFE